MVNAGHVPGIPNVAQYWWAIMEKKGLQKHLKIV